MKEWHGCLGLISNRKPSSTKVLVKGSKSDTQIEMPYETDIPNYRVVCDRIEPGTNYGNDSWSHAFAKIVTH